MPFFDKTINAIKSVGTTSYFGRLGGIARKGSEALANGSGMQVMRDVYRRAAPSGMAFAAGGIGAGAAIGAGSSYMYRDDVGRGTLRGAMYGAGAGLLGLAGKGMYGSMRGGALGDVYKDIKFGSRLRARPTPSVRSMRPMGA